jgi:DNA-binding Lrp family transcriptional regulator
MAMIKGQDIAILLKLAADGGKRQSYARLAADLGLSPSEAHAGVLRLSGAGLVDADHKRVLVAGAVEFLRHGLKYVFPLERRGGLCRGVPTAHAAPCAASVFTSDGEPPPVWPDADGSVRGIGVVPLYRAASRGARKDERLYELLALADLLRGGRARERAWAETRIEKMLKAAESNP